MIGGIGERGQAQPLGELAAQSLGRDAEGRLDDPMLRAASPSSRSTKPPSAR